MVAAPRFRVTQDAAWVRVHVHVPFVRVSEMEFHVDGCAFSFFCKPYLLKLHFPHEVVDDELAKAVYDPNKENGTIVVHLPKKEPGLEFPDLDLLTTLLQPQQAPKVDLKASAATKAAPLIEVVASSEAAENGQDETSLAEADTSKAAATSTAPSNTRADASLLDLEANLAAAAAAEETVRIGSAVTSTVYGFNNAYSDFFRVWHGEVSEILSLPEPDSTPAERRRELREVGEDAQFDIERYLLDFVNVSEDPYFQLAMEYEPFWRKFSVLKTKAAVVVPPPAPSPLIVEVSSTSDTKSDMEAVSTGFQNMSVNDASAHPIFSEADEELLRRLPRKEFLITPGSEEEARAVGGLVDILIGFVYEHLTSQGDSGIESTWTVSILSPTLSWLDTSTDFRAIVRSGVRRMLAFPFLRQYDLAIHVIRETAELLKRGKRVVLRGLLELYRIVEKSETQYLLNALYIQDYCVWIQGVPEELLQRASRDLARGLACFSKGDTGWALIDLERSLTEEPASSDDSGESSSSGSDASSSSPESEGDEESVLVHN